MRKFFVGTVIFMFIIMLVSEVNGLLYPHNPPQLVEDMTEIKELEEANNNYLRDLKAQLMEAIDESEVEKVVFYVNYQNSVDGYLVTLYFKKDDQWYRSYIEQFDSRLSNKLREELGDLIW